MQSPVLSPCVYSAQFSALTTWLWKVLSGFEWVTGVDIAPCSQGACTVRVHVGSLRGSAFAASKAPWRRYLPDTVDGLPVTVVHARYEAQMDTQPSAWPGGGRQPKMMTGVSLGRLSGASGTAALVVLDKQTGSPGVLSSWQVLAGGRARCGDPIVHPGLADADLSQCDDVARLNCWMRERAGDAAFALLRSGQGWAHSLGATDLPMISVRSAQIGEVLTRYGRWGASRSGKIILSRDQAQVDGIGIYRIQYEIAPGLYENMAMQGVRLRPIQAAVAERKKSASWIGAGHQGAVWVAQDCQTGVGLQVAQSDTAVVLSDLPVILKRLGLQLPPVQRDVADDCAQQRWGTVAHFLQECARLNASYGQRWKS